MNLHTSRSKPDWQYEAVEDLTRWQSLALATRGIVTPGNILSLSGLLLVVYGAVLIYGGSASGGLLFILLGRAMDLADGLVAEATKTKSHLGEIVDTTCDKLSILITAVTAYSVGLFSIQLVTVLALHHIYTALYSVLFAKRYRIHTTKAGKIAMFASWIAILVALYGRVNNSVLFDVTSTVVTVTYSFVALVACIDYYLVLQRKIVERMRAAQWTRRTSKIIFIYNPKASNYRRARRWINRISKEMTQQRIDMTVSEAHRELISTINDFDEDRKKVLVAVAGGDGTVSSVANILLKAKDQKLLNRTYLLPLWGGNANDFAYMLNGMSSNNTPHRLLAQSSPCKVPTIHIKMTCKKEVTELYACCYASFGASAYAARELDKRRFANHKIVRYFPLLLMVRELAAVSKALRDAPMFRTEVENKDTELYEHTFINGSRIAKVNRVPLNLSDPAFFHAVIDRKHPSMLIEILRIITKKSRKQYVKKQSVTFTLKDDVNAQIDGEVYPIKQGTKVTVNVNATSLYCISTKLES